MFYATLKLIHILSLIVWIGGMVFAHFFVRPAVQVLAPAVRIPLMLGVLQRFFAAVLVAVALVLTTGLWMVARVAREAAQLGGPFAMPVSWTIMAALGLVMALIFGYIRLVLYKRLQHAVTVSDWAAGGQALAGIRTWVGVNLLLGLAIIAITVLLV
ncbi:MAG: CopD family protein [Burkholderiaceae bacterium]|nr:CopD family protein [Burkholderiaceae bacterium]